MNTLLDSKEVLKTLDEAIKALAECNDWWCPKGTGTIYFQEFGLHKPAKKVYKA